MNSEGCDWLGVIVKAVETVVFVFVPAVWPALLESVAVILL